MLSSMFLVEHNVPDVYVNESRDFQLLSRLYDLALQSTRFSIDSMDYVSDTNLCNASLLALLGSKVGFFSSLQISDTTYRKVLSVFPHIMRYKGSKEGIYLILNLFMHITNSRLSLQESEDSNMLTIIFYDYMAHLDLLQELIECIRPVGLLVDYQFVTRFEPKVEYIFSDKVSIGPWMKYINVDEDTYLSGVAIQTTNEQSDDEEDNEVGYDTDSANNIGFTVISRARDDLQITEGEINA